MKASDNLPPLSAVPFTRVSLADAFWAPRQEVNRAVTLAIEHEQCRKTGCSFGAWTGWWRGSPARSNRTAASTSISRWWSPRNAGPTWRVGTSSIAPAT